MKKIIGVLGVAVIATAMFLSADKLSAVASDASLESLVSLNKANAEGGDTCISCGLVSYDVCITVNYHQYVGYRVFSGC